jgi:protein gp37
MAPRSTIEWTESTWNPIRGCSRVSPGCYNCYAIREAARHAGTHRTTYKEHLPPKPGPYAGLVKKKHDRMDWTGEVRLVSERLEDPLRWTKPRRIFVNSMSDLFHERVPDEWIDQIFAVMALAPRHTFQVLTKRADRMRDYVSSKNGHSCGVWFAAHKIKPPPPPRHWYHAPRTFGWPLPNVWLGVSVEDQERADERIPLLMQTPAEVHFLSLEPLIGSVDLLTPGYLQNVGPIDWVIVGGESGPASRPCDLAWIRSIRDQCQEAGVPAFVKQVGALPIVPGENGPWCRLPQKNRKGGDPSEWPEDLRVREYPGVRP